MRGSAAIAASIALALSAQAADSLMLTWTHHTLTNPLTQTVQTSRGPVTISNTPTMFYIYRSTDLTNWVSVGNVLHTNRFVYVHSGAPSYLYFAATASNGFAGETPFGLKGAGTSYLFGGATNLTLEKQ
jgi:hypothetical protein